MVGELVGDADLRNALLDNVHELVAFLHQRSANLASDVHQACLTLNTF